MIEYKEKAYKLWALATHPQTPTAEAETAMQMLKKLCEKHGIDIDSVGHEKEDNIFFFKKRRDQYLNTLFLRLFWKYSKLPSSQCRYWDKDGYFFFSGSKLLQIEVNEAFEFYSKLYKKEKKELEKKLELAFLLKHSIGGINDEEAESDKKEGDKMSRQELDELMSLYNMLGDETMIKKLAK